MREIMTKKIKVYLVFILIMIGVFLATEILAYGEVSGELAKQPTENIELINDGQIDESITPVILDEVIINLFAKKTCGHCTDEKEFLTALVEKDRSINVHIYYIEEKENLDLLRLVGNALNTQVKGIPFTVIGSQAVAGFNNISTTGKQIERIIASERESNSTDVVLQQIELNKIKPQISKIEKNSADLDSEKSDSIGSDNIVLPFFGKINLKKYSLAAITFLIALVDGFNPCAMWTLLFLITLLLNMKDRKKMFILGAAFILTSGFVYYLLLTAWLDLFLIIGYATLSRVIIGLFAIGAAIYFFRDYQKNKAGVCKVDIGGKKQKVFGKLKKIVYQEKFVFSLIGIILLALAVNVVEAVCSAGLPAVYTQIVSVSQIAKWQKQLYLLFYIIIFMIDDMVIFVLAMVTLKKIGLDGKYARLSHLIGAIIMAVIGLLLIFKPELLMFG